MRSTHVVVLGGGFAGLETAFLLRSRFGEDRLRLTVVSDRGEFLFKPNTIYLPFEGDDGHLRVPLEPALRRRGIGYVPAEVSTLDPGRRTVGLADGGTITYDYLVVATGARANPGEIPGLGEHGRQLCDPARLGSFAEELLWMVQYARHGHRQHVVCVVPPGLHYPTATYELALMLDTWLRRGDIRHQVEIRLVTHEETLLRDFGPKVHDAVTARFAEREIESDTGLTVTSTTGTKVKFGDHNARRYDLLICLPPQVAAVTYPGLPADDRGFLRCEPGTRAVRGYPEIFAPGDAGDFPIKQAFIALRHAEAVADAIGADLTGRPRDDATGGITTMFLLDMLDQALFAQVPLAVGQAPDGRTIVSPSARTPYRVGTGRWWRLGKHSVGRSVPAAFASGHPFHAGAWWDAAQRHLRAGTDALTR
ncbi:NAD(P)/FAD-dependent oxidoreductase [Amycolatopsis suaedae]|uniref:NAD(P)/FAD-dependent oxidoreductase n=1 Tax=Amycolatopsis suaedae TaxID=2510978 RepID=UPI0013EF3F3F|nr:FAD-dependent oxidoreductase [Amycolatopsis suaedae]